MPDNEEIEILITKVLTNNALLTEIQYLNEWKKQDTKNEIQFNQMALCWGISTDAFLNLDIKSARQKVENLIEKQKLQDNKR